MGMKTMVWKFYFWVVFSLDMISFVTPLGVSEQRRVWETLDMGFLLIGFIGLFGFCWDKQMFGRLFWQIFLPCFLTWICFYLYILTPLPSVAAQAVRFRFPVHVITSVALVPHIPLIIGLYLYAFKRPEFWRI